ncbi:spermidine synthase [Streptomyces viridochromogenes]|uniref:Spermidine synthase n=1 Tax=Streptomyces viridochromogenes TaxID=1938 RepID=A0A0J8CET2_STRVR|nr:spermidine synthase [Streptomyces viridochromogenes]KOG23242.1 spermidine synthase [Streptomyces viridochromogenes]KOG27154.1 spermidine synthase [Streptomyces viridochromogenes]
MKLTKTGQSETSVRWRLVLASTTMLFVELALIRWAGANVVHLSYFSNFILLGSFLGIGIGFLIPAERGQWLKRWTPIPLALLVILVRTYPVQVRQSSSEVIYFTAVKTTGLPQWVTLPAIFLLTAVIMAGIGKITADLFRQLPSLDAYRYDLLGSITGSVSFAVLSWLRAPSVAWGVLAAVALLVLGGRRNTLLYGIPLTAMVAALFLESTTAGVSWSPYYKIELKESPTTTRTYHISANGVPHQSTAPLPELMRENSPYRQAYDQTPRNPHKRVLVIGAGNGNDVAVALAHGAERVDAVEIDPRLQEIGADLHPARPYDDPRVHVYIDDGRAFLERTNAKYDLIILALPDSLTLVSGASNLRLESYLFTRQAFEAARDHLNPDGAFAMYNYYRKSWLVDRFAGDLHDLYGHAPCMTTFKRNAAVLVAGMTPADQACKQIWEPSGPVPAAATDDHPFPYLLHRNIPSIYLGALGAILLVTLLAVRLTGVRIRSTLRYTDMFLLGAAFMLLETKNVIGFALYFGTTWLVNALVFFGVLLSVLAAVEVRRRLRRVNQLVLQIMLFGSLAVAWLVPAQAVLSLPPAGRLAAAIALAFAPIFCANLIFSDRLALAPDPTSAFGANLLGALTGGALEYLALMTGYQALLLIVALLYLGACVAMRFAGRGPGGPATRMPDETVAVKS